MILMRELAPEVKSFNEQKLKLVKKHHGVEDEDGSAWEVPEEYNEEFQKDLKPILEETITLAKAKPLVVDELNIDLEPYIMDLIEPVLIESENYTE